MFLVLPEDPLVKGMDPDPSIIKRKNVRKTLIPTAVFPLSLSFNFCVVTPLVLTPHPGLHSDGNLFC